MPDRASAREPSAARNLYAFGFTSFLNDTATEMAYWVLPAFLVSLGAGPAQLGLIEGIAESVASFGKLFSGYLTDRIERRKPLVVARTVDSLLRSAGQGRARNAARRNGRGVR
jgi:MFS family permease